MNDIVVQQKKKVKARKVFNEKKEGKDFFLVVKT